MAIAGVWVKRGLLGLAGLLGLLLLLVVAVLLWFDIPRNAAGMAAKGVCSAAFIAGRPVESLLEQDLFPANPVLAPVRVSVDRSRFSVTARYAGMFSRHAVWLPDRGCVLDLPPGPATETRGSSKADAGKAWPEGDAPLPIAQWPADLDASALNKTITDAFIGAGDVAAANARGLAVVHRGRLIALREAEGFGGGTPLHGWSMTKTVGGMLMHKIATQTNLSMDTPVVDSFAKTREPSWLAAWRADGRKAIKLSDLMYMRDGLDSTEGYEPWSSTPQMLWGETDTAFFAAAVPLAAEPGKRWNYLSTSANLMAAVARGRFESDAKYWAYPREALFDPIGARTAVLETDSAGNWVASSYLWASTADWARLGELLLKDGRWGDKTVLPPGFLKLAQTPASSSGAGRGYGAQSWLMGQPDEGSCKGSGVPEDTVSMQGHWGQRIAVVPSREAVIVRLGWTFKRGQFDACKFVADILQALPK